MYTQATSKQIDSCSLSPKFEEIFKILDLKMKMNFFTKFCNSESSDCSKEENVTELTHGANFAVKWVDSCENCLEDGKKLCKCDTSNDELKFEVKNESNETDTQGVEANSSFLQSVVNMSGMLIGMLLFSIFLFSIRCQK